MSKNLSLLFLALWFCLSSVAADSLRLTVDQCIAIALSENPTIKVADMEITRMDYSRKETLGQLLPSVSFGATYNRTLAKQTMYMNMNRFASSSTPGDDGEETPVPASSSGSNGIKVGMDNSYSAGFSLSLPIIAPQLWKTLDLNDSQILQTVEAARRSRIEMINQVKNAYYLLLLAEDSYKTIQESYDMAKFTADLYAKQYSLGAASRYDVLRTEVALKNVEPELTQATIAIRQAKLQLLILMGMDTTVDISPATALADYQQTMYEDVIRIDRNISGNLDLRMLDIQKRQLDDALEIQKRSLYPTLALTANYNWTSMNDGTPFKGLQWSPYSIIGFTLSVPLFEGFQRVSRIRQAEVQLREIDWQRINLVRSINMQTDLAIENIQLNIKQISSCAESVKQAETAYSIMSQSFEIGAASYLDLRDSELALTRSRLAYYQAIYNYLVAGSDLELLLGNADPDHYTIN
ncbi:MAG: TolC family protein [Bacteroides sp.]|nr:TolC family protein [Bacteroides sp.]MCM1414172.1 TolC family protein [Bacteroides sp.]MCM1471278.1 TolC family protein [Bacteroides sp.]